MGALEPLLFPVLAAGLLGMVAGWLQRRKQIRNEHWLWKKHRLRRARILLRGGGALSLVSVVALIVV